MKVYLAAMYSKMDDMRTVDQRLRALGHEPTSRWVWGNEEGMTEADAAQMDWDDVMRADALVLFTNPLGTLVMGGGRHVEMGMALQAGKWVIVVGDREQVFCHLRCVTVVEDVDALCRRLHLGVPT